MSNSSYTDANNPVGIVSERDLVKNFQKILNREIVLVKI